MARGEKRPSRNLGSAGVEDSVADRQVAWIRNCGSHTESLRRVAQCGGGLSLPCPAPNGAEWLDCFRVGSDGDQPQSRVLPAFHGRPKALAGSGEEFRTP